MDKIVKIPNMAHWLAFKAAMERDQAAEAALLEEHVEPDKGKHLIDQVIQKRPSEDCSGE